MRDQYFEQLLQADRRTLIGRGLTALWLSVALVEFTVWLIIGVVDGLTSPWWLWTLVVGGLVVGGYHVVVRNGEKARS